VPKLQAIIGHSMDEIGPAHQMTACHKVLIVDDHPLTHWGLRLLFARHDNFEIVGALDRCEITTAFIKTQSVDLVVLDLNMPNIRGIDVLAEIVGSDDMTVIILTGETAFAEVDYALKLGARGAVSKADPPEEIIAACEAAVAGEVYLSPSMRGALGRLEHSPVSLSSRQMAILHYLARGESNKEIAYRLSIAQPTVSFHIGELRRKLNAPSNRKIIDHAKASGLI
jgi:DNA-binding NarL/FixJ family response regulator